MAAGAGEVPGEALQVEHYPGGDLPRANPRRGCPGTGTAGCVMAAARRQSFGMKT